MLYSNQMTIDDISFRYGWFGPYQQRQAIHQTVLPVVACLPACGFVLRPPFGKLNPSPHGPDVAVEFPLTPRCFADPLPFQSFLDFGPHIRPAASQGGLASPCGDVPFDQHAIHPTDGGDFLPEFGSYLGEKSLRFP